MRPVTSYLLKTALASGAIALVAASCGGDNSSDGAGSNGGARPAGIVAVASVDGTDVLSDADGHTLYSAEVEKGGHIVCVDACTSFWDPVLASHADVMSTDAPLRDELGVVNRPDGKSQLTYAGMPLYTFASEGADELQGDGFTDDFQGTRFEWSAARTVGSSAPVATQGSEGYDSGGGGYGY